MKLIYTILFFILFLATGFHGMAQDKRKSSVTTSNKSKSQFWKNVKRSTLKAPWILGLGWNVIDDDGKPFNKLFSANSSWNVVPFPSKLSCEKKLIQGWSVEAAANFNQFKTGKTLNNDVLKTTGTFLSVDINGKFSFLDLLKKPIPYFDPYLLHGYGFTYRSVGKYSNVPTANIGLGFNVWIYNDMIGINVQSQAKFALTSPIIKSGGNYLQHSLGIVYKFDTGSSRYGQKPGRAGSKYKFFKTRKNAGK